MRIYLIATAPSVNYRVTLEDGTLNTHNLTDTAITFTLNTSSRFYFYCNVNMDGAKFMLNEGSTALPYQSYEGKTIHEKDLENTKNEINNAKQDKLLNEINIKSINGKSILGSGDLSISGTIPIYGVSQLYKHDIDFDIANGDGIECTFWSTSNNKITDFSQIPYLAFSNIQVKNVSSGTILNVVQWQNDRFLYYDSTISSDLVGNIYDGVTAYYINGEPQL